jgi:pteridine reductase
LQKIAHGENLGVMKSARSIKKNRVARVALVTGAARRIGAAIARELHAVGFNVAIHYRGSAAEARTLAAELNRARSDSAECLRADLLDVGAIEKLVRAAHARWGRLDALVNNASTYERTPLGKIEERDFDALVGSNLKAPLFLAKACAQRMRDGAIVNIVDAKPARAGFAAYGSAKAGLIALTQILALELAPRIRVNAVAPGHILWAESTRLSVGQRGKELSQVPLARLGTPAEIARAVRFLVSADASYLSGAVIPVDGGLHLR